MKARDSDSNGTPQKAARGQSASPSTPRATPGSSAPGDSVKEISSSTPQPSPPSRARGDSAKKNPKREFTVALHGFSSSPPDLLAAIRSRGFFVLTLDCSPLPWSKVKEMDFTPAFECPYIHAEAVGEGGLLSYSPAPDSVRTSRFFKLLSKLFRQTLREPLFGGTSKDLPEVVPGFYKFDARLSLACQLMDSPENTGKTGPSLDDKIIPGFRLIVFNVPLVVDVKVTAGDDFFVQRKNFWDGISELSDESFLFPKGVYYKSSGESVSIPLEAHQVLILPAPCVFLPAVNEGDVYMMTSFIPRKWNGKLRVAQPQGLSLIYTSSAVLTRYPLQKKSFFDSLGEDEEGKAIQEKVLAVEAHTMEMDITKVRQHVRWSPPTSKAVIHPPPSQDPMQGRKKSGRRSSVAPPSVDAQPLSAASPKVINRVRSAASSGSRTGNDDRVTPATPAKKKATLQVKYPPPAAPSVSKKRSGVHPGQPAKSKKKKRRRAPTVVGAKETGGQSKSNEPAPGQSAKDALVPIVDTDIYGNPYSPVNED